MRDSPPISSGTRGKQVASGVPDPAHDRSTHCVCDPQPERLHTPLRWPYRRPPFSTCIAQRGRVAADEKLHSLGARRLGAIRVRSAGQSIRAISQVGVGPGIREAVLRVSAISPAAPWLDLPADARSSSRGMRRRVDISIVTMVNWRRANRRRPITASMRQSYDRSGVISIRSPRHVRMSRSGISRLTTS
jgi:hypothetical protein